MFRKIKFRKILKEHNKFLNKKADISAKKITEIQFKNIESRSKIFREKNKIPLVKFLTENYYDIYTKRDNLNLMHEDIIFLRDNDLMTSVFFAILHQKISVSLLKNNLQFSENKAESIITTLERYNLISLRRISKKYKVNYKSIADFLNDNFKYFNDFDLECEFYKEDTEMLKNNYKKLILDMYDYKFLKQISQEMIYEIISSSLLENKDIGKLHSYDIYKESLEDTVERSLILLLKLREFQEKGYNVTFKYIENFSLLYKVISLPKVNNKSIHKNNILGKITMSEANEIANDLNNIFPNNNYDNRLLKYDKLNISKYIVDKLFLKNNEQINDEQLIVSPKNNDGTEFENLVINILEKNNYDNVRQTGKSNDFGVDVLAEKNGIVYAIQCKNYSKPVGNSAVQEIYTGMNYYNAHVGIVATNSSFTPAAKKQAESSNIVLWDGIFLDNLNQL